MKFVPNVIRQAKLVTIIARPHHYASTSSKFHDPPPSPPPPRACHRYRAPLLKLRLRPPLRPAGRREDAFSL